MALQRYMAILAGLHCVISCDDISHLTEMISPWQYQNILWHYILRTVTQTTSPRNPTLEKLSIWCKYVPKKSLQSSTASHITSQDNLTPELRKVAILAIRIGERSGNLGNILTRNLRRFVKIWDMSRFTHFWDHFQAECGEDFEWLGKTWKYWLENIAFLFAFPP